MANSNLRGLPRHPVFRHPGSQIAAIAIVLFVCAGSAGAQSKPVQSQPTPESSHIPDYSQEPNVIEQYFTRVRFENDGTGERDLAVRIRVQSEVGVQQLGELMFEYNFLGDDSKVLGLENKARNNLSAPRTISLGKLGLGQADAEFHVLLSSASKIEAVKFIKGSENLRPLADRLRALNYPQVFPDATPTKLVRRGILSCSSPSGECVFVLILPEDVHSVD